MIILHTHTMFSIGKNTDYAKSIAKMGREIEKKYLLLGSFFTNIHIHSMPHTGSLLYELIHPFLDKEGRVRLDACGVVHNLCIDDEPLKFYLEPHHDNKDRT